MATVREVEITVEVTYDLPIYTHVTVRAPGGDPAVAGRLALEKLAEEGWPATGSGAREDVESSSPEFVTAMALGRVNPNDAPREAMLVVPAHLSRDAIALSLYDTDVLLSALAAKGVAVLATRPVNFLAKANGLPEEQVLEALPGIRQAIAGATVLESCDEIAWRMLCAGD